MNTGPQTQAVFVQGNQSPAEHDACHSALFYLFQEVSKLASPIHSSFLDADPPSMWQHDTSRPLQVKLEESQDAHHVSDSCSLSPLLPPCEQVIKVEEESHSSEVMTSVEPHPKCNSPWKVLGLINLQCERLMNQDSSSVSSSIKLSGDKSSTAAGEADVVDDLRRGCSRSYKPQCCRKDSGCVRSQTDENSNTESRRDETKQECQREYFSPEQNILHISSQTKSLDACLNAQLPFNSDAGVSLSKPALTLDHNANFTLTTGDAILPSSQPAWLLFTETCQSQKHTPLNSSSHNEETNTSPSETPDPAAPSTLQWRTKTPRKQPHPRRSADIQDPDFQGVTFRMDRQLDDDREQCRLLITSKYSTELRKNTRSRRRPRMRTRTSQKSLKTSSSDEEGDMMSNMSTEGKVCASCCTRKTPMWRDAEDGTPLCNACGIRYKKYRVRCISCWHIPKKEGNYNSFCLKCGNFVRLTSAQRKHSA